MKSLLCPTFIFCYLWAIGGNLGCAHWEKFDNFIKKQFEENRNAKVYTLNQRQADNHDKEFFVPKCILTGSHQITTLNITCHTKWEASSGAMRDFNCQFSYNLSC